MKTKIQIIFMAIILLGLVLITGLSNHRGYAFEGLKINGEDGGNTPLIGGYFSYQGYLTYEGQPANGNFDFRSTIFNAAAVGTELGSDEDLDVPVTDGLFTIVITADNSIFNTGGTRWLELEVRPSGAGTYTTLLPRQEIRPVPQAAYAEYAKHLVDPGDTVIQVSPFDMIQSDGLSSLEFAAKGTGRLEVTRSSQGIDYVYIPVDIPAQIFGLQQQLALKSLRFCYSGFNNGLGIISGIEIATVRQIVNMSSATNMLGEAFDPVLAESETCETVTADTPVVVDGSMWVRFKIHANDLVPLEFGEISLTFTSDN